MTAPVFVPSAPRTQVRRWPASLHLLLGEAAVDVMGAVLDPIGGRLRTLRATSVSLQPDGGATVQYAAVLDWGGARETREALAATTGSRIPDGATVLAGDVDGTTVQVGLWRWPLDPALPALAWATSAASVAARLPELGIEVGRPRLRLRAYRPGRRAVIEVSGQSRRLFLKVVTPSAVERLVQRHAALAGAVPVPPVVAATPDGVVVLPGLPGTPMRALLSGEGSDLPGAAILDAVLDALPMAAAELPRPGRHAPGDALAQAAGHASVLGMVTAELRPRLDRLTAALGAVDPGEHPSVPVHGDFYEAQLLVQQGGVVGLLDVDTVGRGHRIDDWATLLAHLVVLEQLLPRPETVTRYAAELTTAAEGRWTSAQLYPRVAAVLLGLATGPFRVQQPEWPARTERRLALAEKWVRAI